LWFPGWVHDGFLFSRDSALMNGAGGTAHAWIFYQVLIFCISFSNSP
jgi:hypothetical protein